MAKKKSIYDKKLKDINKDGKVNFGDTWLGDALGFDGKLGVEKGRPGLNESLKGARRGKDEVKKDKPKSQPKSRPKKEQKEETKRRSSTGGPARYNSTSTKVTDAGMDEKAKRTRNQPKPQTKAPTQPQAPKESSSPRISYREWEKLSVAERVKRGLPKSKFEWQNQGKFGIPDTKGETKSRTPSTGSSARKTSRLKNAGEAGMAKGGMARYEKKGNRDYKTKGMFYDSKSPKGYK